MLFLVKKPGEFSVDLHSIEGVEGGDNHCSVLLSGRGSLYLTCSVDEFTDLWEAKAKEYDEWCGERDVPWTIDTSEAS